MERLPLIITANGRTEFVCASLGSLVCSEQPLSVRLALQGEFTDSYRYALAQLAKGFALMGHELRYSHYGSAWSVAQMRRYELLAVAGNPEWIAMTDSDVLMQNAVMWERAINYMQVNPDCAVVHLPPVDVDNARGFDDWTTDFQPYQEPPGRGFTAYSHTTPLEYSPTQGLWRASALIPVATELWEHWPRGERGYDVATSKELIGKGWKVVALGGARQAHLWTKRDTEEGLWTSTAFPDHPVVE